MQFSRGEEAMTQSRSCREDEDYKMCQLHGGCKGWDGKVEAEK
jgi:hypothetical protein